MGRSFLLSESSCRTDHRRRRNGEEQPPQRHRSTLFEAKTASFSIRPTIARQRSPMQIAHLDFGERPIFLAPMEDVSDPPFRILCKRYGADMLYTEFISS